MQKIIHQLQFLGLNPNESSVYICLLETGGASPSKISESTKINRSTVYKTLTALSIKGLVNEIEKKNKLFYQAEKPDNLIKFLKNRIVLAEDDFQKAQRLLPELQKIFALSNDKPQVIYLEGADTVLKTCDDMLAYSNYEMLAFSNGEIFEETVSKKYIRQFAKTKERQRIRTKVIIPDTPLNRKFNNRVFSAVKDLNTPQIRYASAEKFPIQAELTIYGPDKVSLTKLTGDTIIGVIIKDKTIHDSLQMMLEIAWESRLLKE